MSTEEKSLNFIEQIIEEDLKNGLSQDKLRFRFPPEPNGYLHIGHASAIALNFGLGIDYKAPVNLRFDDTNPAKEEQEFVDSIKRDVLWLGYEWSEERYASDYFQQLYDWTIDFIKNGKDIVDWYLLSQFSEKSFYRFYLDKVINIIFDNNLKNDLNIFETCLLIESCFKFGD